MYESKSIIQSKHSFEVQRLTHNALKLLDQRRRPYLHAMQRCNYHLSETIVNYQDTFSIHEQIAMYKNFVLRVAELWSLLSQWPKEIYLPGLEEMAEGVKQLYFDLLQELTRKEVHLIQINANCKPN
mgnify:FL=1